VATHRAEAWIQNKDITKLLVAFEVKF